MKKKTIVAIINGKLIVYSDGSQEFIKSQTPERKLYQTLVWGHQGSIKQSDKSIVMRIKIPRDAADPQAELLRQAHSLVERMPGGKAVEKVELNINVSIN